MSKPYSGWSGVLLVVVVTLMIFATSPVEGQLVKWNFANFTSNLAGVSNLAFLGDAAIDNTTGPPRVVLNAQGTSTGVATAGRALYSKQVQFRSDITASFASFTTNFTFAITNLGTSATTPGAGCGGFTFHIRGNSTVVGDSGPYLGLTTATNDGDVSNSLFAVEFDTSQDVSVGDPSVSHMGVDINGVKSTATYNLCPSATNCTTLVNSGVFFTKMSYNGSRDTLQVELRDANATTPIAVTWTVPNISLKAVFQDFMYVGFSGSNGVGCNQTHEIFSWGFSTTRSFGPSRADDAEGPHPHVSYTCYKSGGCESYKALVIGIPAAVGGMVIIAILLVIYFCCIRKKSQSQEYAAVLNDGKSGPQSDKNITNLHVNPSSDDKTPSAHKVPEISLPVYSSTKGKNTVTDPKMPDPPLYESRREIPSTDPELPAPAPVVAKSVASGADDKVVMMCCVQTKPRRDYKEPVVFSFKELSQATKSFSEKEVIGGAPERRLVYRGVLRDNGAVVAIKEIPLDNISNEFLEKAMVLGRIRHPNLVHLLGWCKCEEKGKLYLVYDYMSRGSLDKVMLLRSDEDGFLGFDARQNVLIGVGAGLTYLHEEWEQCVLHRDVKPSNVLLDANWSAHLGNFSHASLVDHNKIAESTIMDGTLGYMAPELPFTGKPTVKSDVFSFGVLILEVICGRLPLHWQSPNYEDRVLVDAVWRAHSDGELLRVVDPKLPKETYSEKQATTLLLVGMWCAHPNPSARPTMELAWQTLIGRAKDPNLPPTKPVVENYAAGLRSLGSRSSGTMSDQPPPPIRFPGMDQIS